MRGWLRKFNWQRDSRGLPLTRIASHYAIRPLPASGARCTEHAVQMENYFAGGFGIMDFIFSRSRMFIFMPPGIMMSPGF
jgi:hypothetical protein